MNTFEQHQGFRTMFQENKLTLGLFFPIEGYKGSVPEMDLVKQMALAKQADEAHFASLFVRDIPLYDPEFGDVGQIYDPWVYLGYLAAQTKRIALATGSIVTTVRHPLHVAKAAASIDKLSHNRLVLGIATGDRPIEFNAFSVNKAERSELFRESLRVIRRAWAEEFPTIQASNVNLTDADVLPKPSSMDIPTLITGHSGQTREWIAKNGDGWLFYPRDLFIQELLIKEYRTHTKEFKPFAQSLFIDLSENPNEPPTGIPLGFRTGRNFLINHLHELRAIGVNHVAFTLKLATRPVEEIVQELAEEVVPHFPAHR